VKQLIFVLVSGMPYKNPEMKRQRSREYMRRKRQGQQGQQQGQHNVVPSTSEARKNPEPIAPPCAGGVETNIPITTRTHAFCIRASYAGSPPEGGKAFSEGNYGNIEGKEFRFPLGDENPRYYIRVFKDRIALILNHPLEGNHAEKVQRIDGYKRLLMRWAESNRLTLSDFEEGKWSDHPFEVREINQVLVPYVQQKGGNVGNRQVYLQTDKSHPDKAEIKGEASWGAEQGAEYLFRVFPRRQEEMIVMLDSRMKALQQGQVNIQQTLTPLLNMLVQDRDALIKAITGKKNRPSAPVHRRTWGQGWKEEG
jgi:hypothetical protein